MISQTSGHGDSRTPDEKSRRFFGQPSKGELLGANFIADRRLQSERAAEAAGPIRRGDQALKTEEITDNNEGKVD